MVMLVWFRISISIEAARCCSVSNEFEHKEGVSGCHHDEKILRASHEMSLGVFVNKNSKKTQ